MRAEDYNNIITKLSNPDSFAEGLTDLSEKLRNDEVDYNKLVDSNNNLRDTNSRLALKITNVVDTSKDDIDPEIQRNTELENEFNSMFK